MSQPFRPTKLDYYPGTTKPIPGGLQLYNINTTFYKDFLSQKLQISPADPGAWHLHAKTTEEYAKQMCAEFKNDKGKWECPRNKPNHYWDCGVYSLAAAEIWGVKFWKKPGAEADTTTSKKKKTRNQKRGGRW